MFVVRVPVAPLVDGITVDQSDAYQLAEAMCTMCAKTAACLAALKSPLFPLLPSGLWE